MSGPPVSAAAQSILAKSAGEHALGLVVLKTELFRNRYACICLQTGCM